MEEIKGPQLPSQAHPTETQNGVERVGDTEIIDLYEYGFTNGLLKVDPDFFDLWVEAFDQEKLCNLKLQALIQQKQELKARLSQTEQQRRELEEQAIVNDRWAQETERKIAQTSERVAQQQAQEETLEKRIEETTPHYKGASVVLFITGGLFFLFADVLFSQNVLTNVLDLPGWEAWILAIAVGAMTFAIKPAVDRVFEQPFIKGENKRRNHVFLLIVSFFILVALGMLGAYRNQAQYLTEERISQQDKIDAIKYQESMGNDLSTDDRTEIKKWPDKLSDFNKDLYLDWRVQTGFILISILFALAGAICFSIGLPAGSQLFVRQKHRRQLNNMLAALDQLKQQFDQLYEQLVGHQTTANIARQQLAHLPDPDDLRADERTLLQKESLLQEERSKFKEQRHRLWYKLGYLRGVQYKLSDQLVVHPRFLGSMFNNGGNRKDWNGNRPKRKQPKLTEGPKQRPNYLHEQLREMIDYNFNQQQNQNGKHDD
ncbi:MAG: hypothetical protein RIC19_16200 [Phaeodactylibacter sp.]|uniref:hypothetical protein n=1 Tax=Phaeodactylibacter sp. TaxID=1940289 RepID=UPI0032F02219